MPQLSSKLPKGSSYTGQSRCFAFSSTQSQELGRTHGCCPGDTGQQCATILSLGLTACSQSSGCQAAKAAKVWRRLPRGCRGGRIHQHDSGCVSLSQMSFNENTRIGMLLSEISYSIWFSVLGGVPRHTTISRFSQTSCSVLRSMCL